VAGRPLLSPVFVPSPLQRTVTKSPSTDRRCSILGR
jgi:hypothetical protein